MLIKIRAFATVTIKILTSKIFFQNTNYLDQFPARLPQTEHTEGQVYAFNSIQQLYLGRQSTCRKTCSYYLQLDFYCETLILATFFSKPIPRVLMRPSLLGRKFARPYFEASCSHSVLLVRKDDLSTYNVQCTFFARSSTKSANFQLHHLEL